jgi:hypothetical protein
VLVDGAGRRLVIPLAFTGSPRESIITFTNPNPVPLTVTASYTGAEGTPKAASTVPGDIACEPQQVDANGTVTVLLRNLCPDAFSPDTENFGFVVLASATDGNPNLFVTTTVESFGVTTRASHLRRPSASRSAACAAAPARRSGRCASWARWVSRRSSP